MAVTHHVRVLIHVASEAEQWGLVVVAAHEPNMALRAARLTIGLTHSQVAEKVAEYLARRENCRAAIDADYVSKLERGVIRWPNQRYRDALRYLFSMDSDEALGFYSPRSAPNGLKQSSPHIVEVEGLPIGDDMLDRDLVRLAGAAMFGALASKTDGILRGALHRPVVPASIDENHVTQLRHATNLFEQSDILFGSGLSQAAATGQVKWACDVLKQSRMHTEIRTQWQQATARLADVTGWMALTQAITLARAVFSL